MNRRRFLASACGALTATFAGCTGGLVGQPTVSNTDNPSVETQTVAYGDTVTVGSVAVTVGDPTTARTQTWEDGDESATAPEGKQWLFVRVTARNLTSERLELPLTLHFQAQVGTTLYQPGRTKSFDRKYVGGLADAGVSHEGTIGFLVPEDVAVGDTAIIYEQERDSGHVRVRWQ